MNIQEEKKIDVLLSQLQERYDALHKMRDRSMQFVLWILGLGLGMAWLLINEASFILAQKILISILLIAIGATTFYFVWSIGQGFNVTRQVIIKLEKSLKLYDKNYYDISDPILPPEKRARGELVYSRAFIYACKPYAWISEFPPSIKSSAEDLLKTKEKWGKVLFEDAPN